jgi:membrane-associated phospholipid phosphatase
VRASIFDFELLSKLGFRRVGSAMQVRHLRWPTTGWSAAYKPFVTISRPSVAQFKEYLVFLDRYADLRGDRASEILTQMGGALTFLSAIPFIHPSRTPFTLELIAAALRLANFTEMRFKQALAARRPNEYAPQVQPMILTPSHGSFPSGHATETFVSASVLARLVRASGTQPYADASWRDQLMRLASRVAINRTVAGVHFPVDSAAGCLLGLALGQYLWRRCTGGATYDSFEFNGANYPLPSAALAPPLDGDFYWEEIDRTMFGTGAAPYIHRTGPQALDPNPILRWLWDKAKGEWT